MRLPDDSDALPIPRLISNYLADRPLFAARELLLIVAARVQAFEGESLEDAMRETIRERLER